MESAPPQSSIAPPGIDGADMAHRAAQLPPPESEASSLLDDQNDEASPDAALTDAPLAVAPPPPTPPRDAPTDVPAPNAPIGEAPAVDMPSTDAIEAPLPASAEGDTAPAVATPTEDPLAVAPALDEAALDARFEAMYEATTRTQTDAWIARLPGVDPENPLYAERAARYRSLVDERRAERSAREAQVRAPVADSEPASAPVDPPQAPAAAPARAAGGGLLDGWSFTELATMFFVPPTALWFLFRRLSDSVAGRSPATRGAPEREEAPSKPNAPDTDRLLQSAEEIAAATSPAHPSDKVHDAAGKSLYAGQLDPVTKGERKSALISGKTDLSTLMCSEFTLLSMGAAGTDLNAPYLLDGTPVAYVDRPPKGPNRIYVITQYDVIGHLVEAAAALLDAQHGTAERVKVGEPVDGITRWTNANDLHGKTVWLSRETTFDGMKAENGDLVGAAASAVSTGGARIAHQSDRRPGDVQQTIQVNDGTYVRGNMGHSSIVHTVYATGVAYLGKGSPTVTSGRGTPHPRAARLPAGWYAIAATSSSRWAIDAETEPANVGKVSVTEAQLIDSNIGRDEDGDRDLDSTGVGMENANPAVRWTMARPTTSRWLGQAASGPGEAPDLDAALATLPDKP